MKKKLPNVCKKLINKFRAPSITPYHDPNEPFVKMVERPEVARYEEWLSAGWRNSFWNLPPAGLKLQRSALSLEELIEKMNVHACCEPNEAYPESVTEGLRHILLGEPSSWVIHASETGINPKTPCVSVISFDLVQKRLDPETGLPSNNLGWFLVCRNIGPSELQLSLPYRTVENNARLVVKNLIIDLVVNPKYGVIAIEHYDY